jgi:hypothetical protein
MENENFVGLGFLDYLQWYAFSCEEIMGMCQPYFNVSTFQPKFQNFKNNLHLMIDVLCPSLHMRLKNISRNVSKLLNNGN